MSTPKSPLQILPQRPLLTIQEVATLGISKQQVRDLIDSGVFLVLDISDNPQAKRRHLRIQRFTVEAWFLEKRFQLDSIELPYEQTPEIKYWREQLRSRWNQIRR